MVRIARVHRQEVFRRVNHHGAGHRWVTCAWMFGSNLRENWNDPYSDSIKKATFTYFGGKKYPEMASSNLIWSKVYDMSGKI